MSFSSNSSRSVSSTSDGKATDFSESVTEITSSSWPNLSEQTDGREKLDSLSDETISISMITKWLRFGERNCIDKNMCVSVSLFSVYNCPLGSFFFGRCNDSSGKSHLASQSFHDHMPVSGLYVRPAFLRQVAQPTAVEFLHLVHPNVMPGFNCTVAGEAFTLALGFAFGASALPATFALAAMFFGPAALSGGGGAFASALCGTATLGGAGGTALAFCAGCAALAEAGLLSGWRLGKVSSPVSEGRAKSDSLAKDGGPGGPGGVMGTAAAAAAAGGAAGLDFAAVAFAVTGAAPR